MSYIEKLLDGVEVEWKTIDSLFHIKNGYTPSKSNQEYWKDGTIPWFRMEDIRQNGRVLNKSIQYVNTAALKGGRIFPANSIIIATSATIGEHALITVPFLSNQRFTCLSLRTEYVKEFEIKFLFYYGFIIDEWCKNNITVGNFAGVDMNGFKKLLIPIPPLSVQKEIVRILDKYTELVTKLTTELTTELTTHKKQYNYYRETLLSFKEGEVEWKTLGEVCLSISSGKNKIRDNSGPYPIFGSTGVIGKTTEKVYEHEQILVARVGANAGYIHIAHGEYDVSDNTLIIQIKEFVLLKYLYYLLINANLNQLAQGAGQPLITAVQLRSLPIPIPPLSVQLAIVRILDKFTELTAELTTELTVELTARKKQYEYYRDLLLTFPKHNIAP